MTSSNGHRSVCACRHCGSLLEISDLAVLAELQEENRILKDGKAALEVQIRKLKRQGDHQLINHPRYEQAIALLQYWRDRCQPGAKQVMCGPRLKNCLARLSGGDGYTVEELKRSVDGYAAFPYVVEGPGNWRRPTGRKDQRQCDAELIFRDVKHVEQGLKLADRADMYRPAVPNGNGSKPPEPEPVRDLGRIGNAALEYVKDSRWHVFPCVPGGKKPATEHGLLAAKTGEVGALAVKAFWSENPNANIGLRTGRESGIVVLDVDDRKGGLESLRELERRYDVLPRTFSVTTPSGGSHYYFMHPGIEIRNTTDMPGPGLDIRGDGGYVLAPPSVVDGHPYEVDDELTIAPLPQWFEEGLVSRQHRTAGNGRVDPAVFERIVRKGVSEGARNDQLLRLTGHLWSAGLLPGEVLGLVQSVNTSRCRPPLPDSEVVQLVDNVRRMRQRERR